MAKILYKFEDVKSEQELRECFRKIYLLYHDNYFLYNESSIDINDFDEIIDDYNWVKNYGNDKLINYNVSKEIYSKCELILNNESRDFLKSLMELEICILDKKYDDNLLAKSLFACESLRPIFIQNILDYIIKVYEQVDDDLHISRYNNKVCVSKKNANKEYTILSSMYDFRDIKSDIDFEMYDTICLPEKPIKPNKEKIKEKNVQKYEKEKKRLPLLRKSLCESQEEYQNELKKVEERQKLFNEHIGELFTPFTTIYGPGFDEPSVLEKIKDNINSIENKINKIENFNDEILEKVCVEEYEKAFLEYKKLLAKYNQKLKEYKGILNINKDCIRYRNLFLEHFGLDLNKDFKVDFEDIGDVSNNMNKVKKFQKTNMYGIITCEEKNL